LRPAVWARSIAPATRDSGATWRSRYRPSSSPNGSSARARAVAALNHPNICTLYDVGPNYLVMEYVEGEVPKGPLPLDTALAYARQIADALEAAHDKGIVHRDLKPGNIKITPTGAVKVL
jgi:serine/threonine protein kinase